MTEDKEYRVKFEIDVDAGSPEEACRRAWELLTAPGALRPIGEVSSFPVQVDLQKLTEEYDDE